MMILDPQREILLEDETSLRFLTADRTSQINFSEIRHYASVCQFSTKSSHISDREPKCDLQSPDIDIDRLWSRLPEISEGFGLELKVQTGRRKYRDSDGLYFEYDRTWCDIRLYLNGRIGSLFIRDGLDDVSRLPVVLEGMAQELLEQQERRILPVCRIPHNAPVELRPSVAGILVHELVGHFLEESDPAPGYIGTEGFSVEARHPSCRIFDDLGELCEKSFLISDGVVPHSDRRERGSGFAQAGWHQGPPIVRFTDITVSPGTGLQATPIEESVICHRSMGAELIDGRALIAISDAELVRGGVTSGKFRPFLLVAGAEELKDTMVGVGRDSLPARAGTCIKSGQELPTRVMTPSLILDGIRLHELT